MHGRFLIDLSGQVQTWLKLLAICSLKKPAHVWKVSCNLFVFQCLGHLTHKIFPDMTYNVFGGTLNPTLSVCLSFLICCSKIHVITVLC